MHLKALQRRRWWSSPPNHFTFS